jgi:hypothetical protein
MAEPGERSRSRRSEFQSFYHAAHAVTSLSEREKILLGLAVAMTRNCEP